MAHWGVVLGLLAGYASAQSVSLHFDADREFAFRGDVVTWTVYASFTGFDDPTAYIGGFVGDAWVEGSDARVVSFENLMSGAGASPRFVGGHLKGINIFNTALLGTNDPSNPIPIFRVGTEIETFLATNMNAGGTISVLANDDLLTEPTLFAEFTVTSDLVNLPGPGGACVLAVGCGLAGRRRAG
tara:strand:+ start:414 stop:968 length:555 start_codon:yes stop_codon:yes gene_type:complete